MRRIVACCAALVFVVCFHLSRSPRSELGGESLESIIDADSVIECGVVPRAESDFAGTVILRERFDAIKSVSSSCGCVSVREARIEGKNLKVDIRIRPREVPEIEQTLKFAMRRGSDTFLVEVGVHAFVAGVWTEHESIDVGRLGDDDAFSVRVKVVGVDEPLSINVEGRNLAFVSQKRILTEANVLHTHELAFKTENKSGEFIESNWIVSIKAQEQVKSIRVTGALVGDFSWRPSALVLRRGSDGELLTGKISVFRSSDNSPVDASRCSVVGSSVKSFVEDGDICVRADVGAGEKLNQSIADVYVDNRLVGKISVFSF